VQYGCAVLIVMSSGIAVGRLKQEHKVSASAQLSQ
jgi:hypothetical protein